MPENRSTICYVISHGFAARMIMQTHLLAQLSDRVNIAIISPDPNDTSLKNHCEQNNIRLFHIEQKRKSFHSAYMLYRLYFLEDIYSNPALYEKHYYETHRDNHKNLITKYLPYLLIGFQNIFRKSKWLRNTYQSIEKHFLHSKEARDLLQSIKPDLVVATYPVNYDEGVLLHEANKLKIPTVIHLLSWDNITSKGHFLATADKYLAWGPIMKSELMEKYNVQVQNVSVCGVPHFDLHYKSKTENNNLQILNEFGLSESDPFILFGMSSPRFVPSEIEIVEFLANQIKANEFGEKMKMVIRPHPQNVKGWMADVSWIERIKKLENDRIKIFYPLLVDSKLPWSMQEEDMTKLSKLLSSCVVCINSCSTLSIDALLAGRPNIAPMFDGNSTFNYWHSAKRLLGYTHIKKFVGDGGSIVVHKYDELILEIKNCLAESDYQLDMRKHAIERQCLNADGKATERVQAALLKIFGEHYN